MITPEFVRCKICRGTSVYLCDTHNEHSRTATLHHYRCTECGVVFVADRVGQEELAEAYSSLDPAQYYEEIGKQNERKFEACIKDLSALAPLESRILDLGTGNGQFVEKLVSRGFKNVSCHEIPGSDLSRVERLGCGTYRDYDYATIPSETFDLVTLLDVAEHVPDPQYLFLSCHRVLRRGGKVYLHTPVVTRFDRLMHRVQKVPVVRKFGQVWQRARTSIFHLQNYTPKALEALLRGSGFEKVSIRVGNELSWPVSSYVKVYLCEKHGVPIALAPIMTLCIYPLVGTNFFNRNKAIAWAEKAEG